MDLGSVKNVGIAAVNAIVKEREENGAYESFTDFCERMQNEISKQEMYRKFNKSWSF